MPEIKYGVDAQHPALVNGINNMITRGYTKDTICRITGAPPEVVDHHIQVRKRQGKRHVPDRDEADE